MNVLHVIEGIDSKLGGLPVAMFGIRAIEKELGIHSHVLSIQDSNLTKYSQEFHLFHSSFPKRFYQSSSAIKWLKANIEQYDLVVIHGFWNLICIQSALVAIDKQVKYVIWPHGSLDPFDLQKKKVLKQALGKLVAAKILKNAHEVCFTSQKESTVVETYGMPINRTILPLPVTSISSVPSTSQPFRAKYGIKKDEFTFLFLGRISYKKGIELIIKTTKKLHTDFKNIRVIIAGHDKSAYAETCKLLVKSLGLTRVVTFCGELKGRDKAEAFYGCDCFILPSLNENFGIATIEALQHSLPVIISDNVYIWKEIDELQGGWICEADENSLLSTMKHVLTDTQDYTIKKATSKSAGDYFLPENLLNQYSSFYKEISSRMTTANNILTREP